jgi:hypothetical protein
MKHKLLLVLLGLGTIAGYTNAVLQHHHWRAHRAAWKERVADVCVQAARRQLAEAQQEPQTQ